MANKKDYWVYQKGELDVSQCVYCKHKHDTGGTCEAFPDGIPEKILLNKSDHTKPYPGDGGVRFEKRED